MIGRPVAAWPAQNAHAALTRAALVIASCMTAYALRRRLVNFARAFSGLRIAQFMPWETLGIAEERMSRFVLPQLS